MARILAFPENDRGKRAQAPRGPATIVIFPGVRYERLDDKRASEPRRRRPRRKAQGILS